MKYDRIILELMDRVSRLESEIDLLKQNLSQTENVSEFHNLQLVSGTPLATKDTTKYIMDGKRYGKNRLVLAVVHKYVSLHPNLSATQLMTIFDRSLQGSLGVVRTLEDVKNNYADYERRFFCQPTEIVCTTTEKCVVCTQWGKFNIGNFIARARQLDITIDEI